MLFITYIDTLLQGYYLNILINEAKDVSLLNRVIPIFTSSRHIRNLVVHGSCRSASILLRIVTWESEMYAVKFTGALSQQNTY